MKALTLWQPHAGLIVLGYKSIETRGWKTDYRGPLAIHAGKRFDAEYLDAAISVGYIPAYWRDETPRIARTDSAILCVVDLVDCRPMTYADEASACCDCPLPSELGKFAWVLRNVRPCVPFIGCKGHQGLWETDLVDITGHRMEACLSPRQEQPPAGADQRQLSIPWTR